MTPQHQPIAQKLDEIEAELKRIGYWQEEALPPEAYNITQAFGMDTMTAEQWLQFILIPRARKILGGEGQFPESSATGAFALRSFPGLNSLINLLYDFDELITAREDAPAPAPAPVASKYGFKTAEEKKREEETAKIETARPVLAAWEARMSASQEEQQSLEQLAGEIAPKVEDVLREWVAVNKGSLSDHFVPPDPFVARSENGANWGVFLHEDEEAFVSYLWCVSLTLDGSKRGDPPMLAVDSARGAIKDEADRMAQVLGDITGLPARQLYDYGSERMNEKSLNVADVLKNAPNIPVRPARPNAYYRVHGEMKYDKYFALAMNWIRLEA